MSIQKIFVLAVVLYPFSLRAQPLHDWVRMFSLSDVINAIEAGADLNALNEAGDSALDVALETLEELHGFAELDCEAVPAMGRIIFELRRRGALTGDQVREQLRVSAARNLAALEIRLRQVTQQAPSQTRQAGQVQQAAPRPHAVGAHAILREITRAQAEFHFGTLGRQIGPRPPVVDGFQNQEHAQNLPNELRVTRRFLTGRSPETMLACEGELYIANEGSNDVDVISVDPPRTIAVGAGPRIIALVNGLLYVANHRSNTITVIDTQREEVLATLFVGEGPFAGVLAGHLLFVTVLYSGQIVVINTRTQQVVDTIEVGRAPRSIAAANGFVFVTNLAGELVIIDELTHRVLQKIAMGASDHPPKLLGDHLFFENAHAPGLAVLDTRTLNIVETIPFAQGAHVLATRDDDTLYVTDANARDIHVINRRRPPEERRIIHLREPAAGAFIHGGYLFVRHANVAKITVFNIASSSRFGRVLATIALKSLGLAMELFNGNLGITLESGGLVLVDLDQLRRLIGEDVAAIPANPIDEIEQTRLEEEMMHILGLTEQQTRRPGFMWE